MQRLRFAALQARETTDTGSEGNVSTIGMCAAPGRSNQPESYVSKAPRDPQVTHRATILPIIEEFLTCSERASYDAATTAAPSPSLFRTRTICRFRLFDSLAECWHLILRQGAAPQELRKEDYAFPQAPAISNHRSLLRGFCHNMCPSRFGPRDHLLQLRHARDCKPVAVLVHLRDQRSLFEPIVLL